MGLAFRIEPKADYLYVEITGTFDMKDVQDGSCRVLNACVQFGLTKVLMDNRKAHGHVSVMDRWTYAQFMVSQIHDLIFSGKLTNAYFAYLGDELIDPQKFGQMVANNRGVSALATTDLQEAFRWLGIQPPVDENH